MITVQNVIDSYNRFKRDISDVPPATILEWNTFMAEFVYDKTKKVYQYLRIVYDM